MVPHSILGSVEDYKALARQHGDLPQVCVGVGVCICVCACVGGRLSRCVCAYVFMGFFLITFNLLQLCEYNYIRNPILH